MEGCLLGVQVIQIGSELQLVGSKVVGSSGHEKGVVGKIGVRKRVWKRDVVARHGAIHISHIPPLHLLLLKGHPVVH